MFGILDPTIVGIAPETNRFQQMVHQVERTDAVLEIGCSTFETSRINARTVQELSLKSHLVSYHVCNRSLKAEIWAFGFGGRNIQNTLGLLMLLATGHLSLSLSGM